MLNMLPQTLRQTGLAQVTTFRNITEPLLSQQLAEGRLLIIHMYSFTFSIDLALHINCRLDYLYSTQVNCEGLYLLLTPHQEPWTDARSNYNLAHAHTGLHRQKSRGIFFPSWEKYDLSPPRNHCKHRDISIMLIIYI